MATKAPTLMERVEKHNQDQERYNADLAAQRREIELMQADDLASIIADLEAMQTGVDGLTQKLQLVTDGRAGTLANVVSSFNSGLDALKREQERIAQIKAQAESEGADQ